MNIARQSPFSALLWKEWRAQRWRAALACLVITTMSAGLVRAQILTTTESILWIFGAVGLLLTIFLAMGNIATERQDRTWPFFAAQPVSQALVLRTKWLLGALSLVAALLLAGAAAHLAALSRGLFSLPAPPQDAAKLLGMANLPGDSVGWLWRIVLLAIVSLVAWYTVLFFALNRARTELHAGLAGILLTLVALAWLLQYPDSHGQGENDWLSPATRSLMWQALKANPLAPITFCMENTSTQITSGAIAICLWTLMPLWLVGRLRPRRRA